MSTRKVSSVRATSPQTNGGALRRAVNWIVNDSIFHDLKLHGNVTWKASGLVCLRCFGSGVRNRRWCRQPKQPSKR